MPEPIQTATLSGESGSPAALAALGGTFSKRRDAPALAISSAQRADTHTTFKLATKRSGFTSLEFPLMISLPVTLARMGATYS